MPRQPIGKTAKTLAVIRKAKTADEREKIGTQIEALQLAAHWAGFTSYQQMTVHFWDRMVAQMGDILDGYTELDATIRAIAERIRANAGKIERLK